jgi:hypothetical protein
MKHAVNPRNYKRLTTGYFAVHRSIFDHPSLGPGNAVKPADPRRGAHSRMEAFLDLIARAAHAPHKNGVTLDRGQAVVCLPALADQWNWTTRQVRRFFDFLRAEGDLKSVTLKGRAGYIITLCKYDEYQPGGVAKGQSTGQSQDEIRSEHIEKKEVEKKVEEKKDSTTSPHATRASRSRGKKVNSGDQPVLPCVDAADQDPRNREKVAEAKQVRVFADMWNGLAPKHGLPRVRLPLVSKFDKAARGIVRRGATEAEFGAVLQELVANPWNVGKNDRNWKADFEYVCRAAVYEKLVGNLDARVASAVATAAKSELLNAQVDDMRANDIRLRADAAEMMARMSERRRAKEAPATPVKLNLT